MLKLRMARAGAKNRPFYHIVVADSRAPRDGNFLEKLGTYNPFLNREDPKRVVLNIERMKYWLSKGAQPSDRVAIFLGRAGAIPMPERKNNPQKAVAKAKMTERAKERAKKAEAANAPAPAEAPTEAPAEKTEG